VLGDEGSVISQDTDMAAEAVEPAEAGAWVAAMVTERVFAVMVLVEHGSIVKSPNPRRLKRNCMTCVRRLQTWPNGWRRSQAR